MRPAGGLRAARTIPERKNRLKGSVKGKRVYAPRFQGAKIEIPAKDRSHAYERGGNDAKKVCFCVCADVDLGAVRWRHGVPRRRGREYGHLEAERGQVQNQLRNPEKYHSRLRGRGRQRESYRGRRRRRRQARAYRMDGQVRRQRLP